MKIGNVCKSEGLCSWIRNEPLEKIGEKLGITEAKISDAGSLVLAFLDDHPGRNRSFHLVFVKG